MRSLLLVVALVALPLAWLAVLWLFVRDRAVATLPGVTVGDRLNVALFVLTIVSTTAAIIGIAVALASYRQATALARWQLEAGNQQSKALESQTEALAAAREALNASVRASEQSQQALEAQIEFARRQKAAEDARRTPRPRLEVDFGNTSWATIRQVLDHNRKIAVSREEFRSSQTRFTIRNVGGMTLVRPVVVLSASDPTVSVTPRQFSGSGVQDVAPYATAGQDYTYEATINIPPTVNSFDLTLEISGDNMPARQLILPIVLVEG